MPDRRGRAVRYAGQIGEHIWSRLPESFLPSRPVRALGRAIHRHYARHQNRVQSHYTWFLRNRPQLEALAARLDLRPGSGPLKIASIGCSTGAELYSALWVIRRHHPSMAVDGYGIDVSEGVVEAARAGRYDRHASASVAGCFEAGTPEVEHLPEDLIQSLFIVEGDSLTVRDWVRAGTSWLVADVLEVHLARIIGQQDGVLANNLLGPMEDDAAEACLHRIVALVKAGGFLVLDGVDLDLKVRVVNALGLWPLADRLDEIWTSDPSKGGWPWVRWAHEPVDRGRADWLSRYSTLFQVGGDSP